MTIKYGDTIGGGPGATASSTAGAPDLDDQAAVELGRAH